MENRASQGQGAVKPFAHKSVFHITLEWAVIFATIFVSHRLGNPLLYIPAIILIGSRQHALLLLMHEATHWRLFNDKRLNDWACEAFVTWPVLTSLVPSATLTYSTTRT